MASLGADELLSSKILPGKFNRIRSQINTNHRHSERNKHRNELKVHQARLCKAKKEEEKNDS